MNGFNSSSRKRINNHSHSNQRNSGVQRHKRRSSGSAEETVVALGSPAYKKAQQSRERYTDMAKEAHNSGDRVQAEYWYQHADHYARIIIKAHEEKRTTAPVQEVQPEEAPEE